MKYFFPLFIFLLPFLVMSEDRSEYLLLDPTALPDVSTFLQSLENDEQYGTILAEESTPEDLRDIWAASTAEASASVESVFMSFVRADKKQFQVRVEFQKSATIVQHLSALIDSQRGGLRFYDTQKSWKLFIPGRNRLDLYIYSPKIIGNALRGVLLCPDSGRDESKEVPLWDLESVQYQVTASGDGEIRSSLGEASAEVQILVTPGVIKPEHAFDRSVHRYPHAMLEYLPRENGSEKNDALKRNLSGGIETQVKLQTSGGKEKSVMNRSVVLVQEAETQKLFPVVFRQREYLPVSNRCFVVIRENSQKILYSESSE